MSSRVVADTGPLVAIVRSREKAHKKCSAALKAIRPPTAPPTGVHWTSCRRLREKGEAPTDSGRPERCCPRRESFTAMPAMRVRPSFVRDACPSFAPVRLPKSPDGGGTAAGTLASSATGDTGSRIADAPDGGGTAVGTLASSATVNRRARQIRRTAERRLPELWRVPLRGIDGIGDRRRAGRRGQRGRNSGEFRYGESTGAAKSSNGGGTAAGTLASSATRNRRGAGNARRVAGSRLAVCAR